MPKHHKFCPQQTLSFLFHCCVNISMNVEVNVKKVMMIFAQKFYIQRPLVARLKSNSNLKVALDS